MTRWLRILAIEDNDPRFELLAKMFAHPRVRIARASTGGAALRMVRTDAFDLILLDHDLHESLGGIATNTSGMAVARALAAGGPNRQTPIRIHSMNLTHRQEMCDFLGANGFDAEVVPMNTWTTARAQALVAELLDGLDD